MCPCIIVKYHGVTCMHACPWWVRTCTYLRCSVPWMNLWCNNKTRQFLNPAAPFSSKFVGTSECFWNRCRMAVGVHVTNIHFDRHRKPTSHELLAVIYTGRASEQRGHRSPVPEYIDEDKTSESFWRSICGSIQVSNDPTRKWLWLSSAQCW